MLLKPNLLILNYPISTIWLFLLVGCFLYVFAFWYEGKKDGFDVTKLLDLALLALISSVPVVYLISLWYKSLQIYHYNSLFLKLDYIYMSFFVYSLVFGFLLYIYSLKLNWSKYRLLDIFAIAFMHIIVMWGIGELLIYKRVEFIALISALYLVYIFFLQTRGKRFLSGYGFSALLFVGALLTPMIYKRSGYLLFSFLLATISLLIVYFRRKNSMATTNLTSDFLKFIKNKLNFKQKELRAEESLIKKEDPYLQPGRENASTESMDGAILEDSAKELSDAKLKMVQDMQNQTRKAVSSMKAGTYGICEICGKPIDKARLKVYPEATKCVDCSSKSEK